ncbi:MAG: zinc-binding dehydrogenase [Chloroflexi bacterium]|jgi:threonine dehydrogenase-like Zn-dependent dehydrogenase|nr:zinc-binding dehydrogenase [Chloroflexota bacterium]MBT5628638.1 zinc-binding dehydrogenase [Chloroflexota bacterium]
MQAIVLHGKQDIRYTTDYPKPEPKAGEVLLRMTYSSICQTDIEMWQHGMFNWGGKPHIQGHEAAGVVVEIGPALDEGPSNERRGSKLAKAELKVGDRVAVENVRTCGTCFFCRKGTSQLCENGRNFGFSDDGGLAEFGVWPASLCIPLPDNMTNEEAPLAEPTSVAVHAVENANVVVGETAAVIGCGVVGLCTLQVLKAAGLKVIAIDPREQSLKIARELGADEVLNPNEVDAGELLPGLTNGYGPDVIIETAGAPGTGMDAANWVRRGGRVVIVGFSHTSQDDINFGRSHMGEKTIMGSSATSHDGYRKAVALIASGAVNVKPLISALVPLDKGIEDGFERMLKPEKDVYRILVGNG